MASARAYYRDRFGFLARYESDGFSVLVRDDGILHVWAATDESWRSREDFGERPIVSGAESFLAGTASCRIEVRDVDALYAELSAARVLHSVSVAGITVTDFGTREFSTVDLDNNAIAFFQREIR